MTTRPDFSALFSASPYSYLLIDTGFVIIGANPAYLRAAGRTADDIVEKNIFDAFPANPSDPDSTNLDEVRTSIELAISTRQPHTSALLRYATRRFPRGHGVRRPLLEREVLVACGFATAAGVFFGFYPARRASRLLPVDCLRYE